MSAECLDMHNGQSKTSDRPCNRQFECLLLYKDNLILYFIYGASRNVPRIIYTVDMTASDGEAVVAIKNHI